MSILLTLLQLDIAHAVSGAIGGIGGAIAGGLASFGVGTGLGLLTQGLNNSNQLSQNQALLNQQKQYNEDLTTFNEQTQLDMWNKTNYAAQVEQMNKAGLNPALMYKGGAGGMGSTAVNTVATSQPGVVSSPSTAIEHQQEMNQRQEMQDTQIKNTDADTAKKIAEELNTEADTDNKSVQNQIMQFTKTITSIQSQIATATQEDIISQVSTAARKLTADMHIANTNQWIAENNAETVVNTGKAMLAQVGLQNILLKSQDAQTKANATAITTGIIQRWKEISIEGKNAETNWINAITNQQNAATNAKNAGTNSGNLQLQQYIHDMTDSDKTLINALMEAIGGIAILAKK